MKKAKLLIKLIICAVFLASFAGCISANSKSSEVVIQLSETGRISIDEKPVALSQLCERLKGMGVTPRTSISIEIPPRTTQTTLRTVSSTLASGGFRKILFKKPKVSSAKSKK